jgi:battenin
MQAPLLTANPSYSPSAYRTVWLCFFTLGCINNFGYVVVLSCANSLANSFDQGALIGLVAWANVFFGFAFKFVNTMDRCLRSPHRVRLLACVVLLTLGLLIVSLSIYVRGGFYVAILGIVFIGIFSSWGESILLGYLNFFPPTLTGAWSSGTGMAGVGGTAFYLGARSLFKAFVTTNEQHINQYSFLMLIPQALIYWLVFNYVSQYTTPDRALLLKESLDDGSSSSKSTMVTYGSEEDGAETTLLTDHPQSIPTTTVVVTPVANPEVGWSKHLRCLRLIANLGCQLAAVYFFEYVVSVGFAAKANPSCESRACDFWNDNAYEILALMYQIGVLISRSSVTYYRVHKIWVLTTLQGLNFVLWFLIFCSLGSNSHIISCETERGSVFDV